MNLKSWSGRVVGALPVFFLTLLLGACDASSRNGLLPAADFVADAGQGERLFRSNCARCHGPAGSGSRQGPPLVDPVYRPGHHADLAFFWAVKDGVRQHHWQFGDMPPIAGLSAEDVANIVAYVRAEQRRQGIR